MDSACRSLTIAPHAGTTIQRCLIADDHRMFAQVLAHLLSTHFGFQIAGLAGSLAEAQAVLEQQNPELVILDLDLGDGSALSLLKTLQDDQKATTVIVLSGYVSTFFCPEHLRPLIAAVVDKSQAFETIVNVIERVLEQRGGPLPTLTPAAIVARLTKRERDVFSLLGRGMSSKQIAAALNLSVRTVETHRKHIVSKSGVSGAELMRLATLATQAIPPDPPLTS